MAKINEVFLTAIFTVATVLCLSMPAWADCNHSHVTCVRSCNFQGNAQAECKQACSDTFRACIKPQCFPLPTTVTLGDQYYVTGAGLTYGMSLHVYLKDKNGQPISGNACDNCVAGDGTFDVGPFGIPSFLWDNPAPTWAWWTGTDL